MNLTEEQIDTLTSTIWEAVLQLPLEHSAGELSADEQRHAFTASVGISGAWQGTVTLCATETFASDAARIMFAPETPSVIDMRDALGELVNMIGGNMKSLLPQPAKLSLPVVELSNGTCAAVPGETLLHQASMKCGRHTLLVRLFQAAAQPTAISA